METKYHRHQPPDSVNVWSQSDVVTMFKSTLGLGLGSTKKSDLNAYLKTLEKKNKEVQRRFSLTETDVKKDEGEETKDKEKVETEEDSDLLSIQKELEDEFDSPYIKKKDERRPSAADEV